jgi:adenylate kinase family enzyme
MSRIVIIGNAGGGKSTLARKLAKRHAVRHIEIDRLLWQEGWVLTPADLYMRRHNEIIESDDWLIDGLGRQASIPDRINRGTQIILIDMPLWIHFWLAAERQIDWASGKLEHAPGGIDAMPSTHALFRTIWDVEQTWMPGVRKLCDEAERRGTTVTRLANVDELDSFAAGI